MLARINSSLTETGPICWMRILTILEAPNWAHTPGAQAKSRKTPQRRSNTFIIARSVRHVFVAHFGSAFKSSIGLQERQAHIPGRAVALLGNQQVDRGGFFRGLVGGRALFFVRIRLV